MSDERALLSSVHAENELVALKKRMRDPNHPSVKYAVFRVDLGGAARAYARALEKQPGEAVKLYHGTSVTNARLITRSGFEQTMVFTKESLQPHYALEHGTNGAVIELDYYDDHTHERQAQFTWIVRSLRVIPRRVFVVDEMEVGEASAAMLGPPPLMRARRG